MASRLNSAHVHTIGNRGRRESSFVGCKILLLRAGIADADLRQHDSKQ